MILSIIIPVYNVEPFVEKCIRSCEAQDVPKDDYEIVVVNDGSKDNSLDVVNRVANEFENIRVLSQPNAGLSAARNTGMREAKGEYYMFVDSDDWIAENCLAKLIGKLRKERPDALAICAANVINGENIRRQSYPDETPISGRDLLVKGVSPCAPFSIWSADFFKKHNLTFFEGIFHEDSEFTPRAYYLADKVSLTNDIIYYVRQNPNSITRSSNPKKSFDVVNVVCPHLSEFSKCVDTRYQYLFHDMVSMYLNNALFNIVDTSKDNQQRLNEAIFNNRSLFMHLKRSTILKYRLEFVLFTLFPRRYVQVYKMLKLNFRSVN